MYSPPLSHLSPTPSSSLRSYSKKSSRAHSPSTPPRKGRRMESQSPYTRAHHSRRLLPADDNYTFAFQLIQQGSAVKYATKDFAEHGSNKFGIGLRRLSDAALLSALKAKAAAKAAMEVENNLWLLRSNEYRCIADYLEASRTMIDRDLSISTTPDPDEVSDAVDSSKEITTVHATRSVDLLLRERQVYTDKAGHYKRLTTYMNSKHGGNADSLRTLELQLEVISAQLKERSHRAFTAVDSDDLSDQDNDEEPSNSDLADSGDDTPTTPSTEDDDD